MLDIWVKMWYNIDVERRTIVQISHHITSRPMAKRVERIIMARTENTTMFTRTITATIASVKAVNNDTDEISVYEFTVADDKADDVAIKKMFNRLHPELTAMKVTERRTVSSMFGITLAQFMSMAVELDPETRKPLEK